MLNLSAEEIEGLDRTGSMLPVAMTPYYMSLISADDPNQPLRRTVIPTAGEFTAGRGEADDPLGEDGDSPVPGLVHRYPDRVLLLAIDFCSTYCRYCTRSRVVGHGELAPNEARLEQAFDYIRRTPTIRDVLISGGDPLALSDDRLDWILRQPAADSARRVRPHRHQDAGRAAAADHAGAVPHAPQAPSAVDEPALPPSRRMHARVVPGLHPAGRRRHSAGLADGAAAGVNDNVETMKKLVHRLLMMRVRPYYLYQCDPITGSSHFRTPVSKGLEIIEGLRGHTTGYAVPTYVIDAPGGGGKIPLQPNYVVGRDGDDLLLRNFEGNTYRYPDPEGAGA